MNKIIKQLIHEIIYYRTDRNGKCDHMCGDRGLISHSNFNKAVSGSVRGVCFVFMFTLFGQGFSFAQSPGNVGYVNLTAWWKADGLSGNVTNWSTTFPSGGSAISVTDGSSPYCIATNTPVNNIFNYNTVVNFDGNTTLSDKALSNTTVGNLLTNQTSTDRGTFFAVYATPTNLNQNDGVVTYRGSGNSAVQLRGLGVLAIGQTNSINGARTFVGLSPAERQVMASYYGNKSGAATMAGFFNGQPLSSSGATAAHMDNNSLTFGAKRNATFPNQRIEYFGGYLAEVIFYDDNLSTGNDMLRVHSYLAVKYGITIPNIGGGIQGDYLSSSATLIWDASVSANYHNDVIGIARDDNQALLQKQSHTLDDTTRIYVSALQASNAANTGSFSSNNSFVMVGHNSGKMCATFTSNAEMPTGLTNCLLYSRLEREWKVTKTNFGQSFNADFTLNNCANPGSVDIAHLRLLVDNDGNFGNGGTQCYYNGDGTGISISYTGGVISVKNISNTHIANNSTKYITIASIESITPLPVELTSFGGSCQDNGFLLNWITSSELNNDYFMIERSMDAVNFEKLATVNGNGTTQEVHTYNFLDESRSLETTYYRLSQVDFNGDKEIFEIISTQCEFEDNFIIYPNPINDVLFLKAKYSGTLELFDVAGKRVLEVTFQAGVNQIGVSDLAKGSYTTRLTANFKNPEIIKLIK